MRTKLFLASILSALVAPFASAQNYYQLFNGGTANVAASAQGTNATANNIAVRDASVIGISKSFKLDGAGTEDMTTHIDGSVDGSTWVLDIAGPLIKAATGTTLASGYTNFDCRGYTTIRVRVENGSSGQAITNLSVAATLWRGSTATVILDVAHGGTGGATALAARTGLGIAETATNSIIPIAKGGTASATVAAAKTAFGIQSGISAAGDAAGNVTNAFATAFSVAPVVLAVGTNGYVVNVSSVTTTNFIAGNQTNAAFNWIAIGAP